MGHLGTMEYVGITLICAFVSFFIVLIMTPWLIRYLRKINLCVKDMNKKDEPLVPISGGLSVMAGLIGGLMLFIFILTFFYNKNFINGSLSYLFAAITSMVVICFIGFVDDILIRKDKESSGGLKQWQKPLLTLPAAIPFMVVKAGMSTLTLPFIGRVDIGLLYPLFFVPIGVVGAANMVNLLEGFNGMGSGMGIIYTGMLGIYTFVNGKYIAALIAFVAFFSLLAFYYYNKYPAKILPGDSLTYLLGAVIASIAILGDVERAALIASVPFMIEFILKARSKFKAQSYGYYKDGKIYSNYDKIYSITHLFMNGKYTEKQITYFMIFIELVFSSLIWFI